MISVELVNGQEVVAKFDRMAPRLKAELRTGVERLAIKLDRRAVAKVSGDVLNVRTGRLRRSIRYVVEASGDTISGIVSSPVKYAAAHEYGFKGSVNVREYMRTVKQAFGKPISPVDVTVRAHTMKMNLPERSFLRSSLREMQADGDIRAEMDAAAQRALT